ncbi:hypothetical protein P152DRAFT_462037 [Eremomyces bilateralis CBS 781.70]|uniref:Uncharacterized protein n=1 Tax=Eremomyces bilateralis CBS 781.70 TaxID=1392243 RepID=A0A6G1FT91_9PEZI|nr:uncharacterized protein P152DRAFT_462037 [Eremomyces bilateralis CBS 781.70]KAF1808983.1 hypothetical protein P152DRAFT_462037 [Eremomyces bilateralis CBS 781.70]
MSSSLRLLGSTFPRSHAILSSGYLPRIRPQRSIHLSNRLRRSQADKSEEDANGVPSLSGGQRFTFEALGITGWAKWSIVAVLSILGTMETIFYAKWAWGWWNQDGRPKHDE